MIFARRRFRQWFLPLITAVVAILIGFPPGVAHADGFSAAAAKGAGTAFLFAFTAGLLTALTPCVYPMIPITVSVFGARNTTRPRALWLATLYVAGIAVTFGTLGTTFALLGKAFGTFLANPWVIVPLAAFFALMAASMFGAFELSLPVDVQARLAQFGGRGAGGAFAMGLVAGLVAAPCTGPPLAGILAYVATTRDAVRGFALLATYAVGIGVPFWAIAGFSMSLPRSGRWLEAVKSVFGIALLWAALYYLKNVIPALGHFTGRTPWFLGLALLLVAAGLALGAIQLSFHDRLSRQLRKGLGVGLAVVGLMGGVNYLLTPKIDLAWEHSESQALARARSQGRPVVVDFMAQWCLPCKEMEVQVFSHPDVAAALGDFVLLKVDLTREDEDEALPLLKKKYGVETLPAVRLVSPSGTIVESVNQLIAPAAFLEALGRARS
jgi:thiol:disulfide interchange protein DsbD